MLSYKSDLTGDYAFITCLSLIILFRNPYFYYIEKDYNHEKYFFDKKNIKTTYSILYIYLIDFILIIFLYISILSLHKKHNGHFFLEFQNEYGNIVNEKYGFEMSNDIEQYTYNDSNFDIYKWNLVKYNNKNGGDYNEKNILYTLTYEYKFNKLDNYPDSFDFKKKYHKLNEEDIREFICGILYLCALKHIFFIKIYFLEFMSKYASSLSPSSFFSNLLFDSRYVSLKSSFISAIYMLLFFACFLTMQKKE